MKRIEFMNKVCALTKRYSVITKSSVTYVLLDGKAIATISEVKECAYTVDFSVGNIPYASDLIDTLTNEYAPTPLAERKEPKFLVPIGPGLYLAEGPEGMRIVNEEIYWSQFEINRASKKWRLTIDLDALKIEVNE